MSNQLEFGDHGESEDDIDLDAPLTPEEEAAAAARAPIEDAMEHAIAVATEAGESDLAACLTALLFFWDIGPSGIGRAAGLLRKVVAEVQDALNNDSIPIYFPGTGETDASEDRDSEACS